MNRQHGDTSRQSTGWLRRSIPLLILIGLVAVAYGLGLHRLLGFASLAEHRDALKAFIAGNFVLALIAYMAVYVAVVSLSLPGGVYLTLAGGFLFGLLIGGAVTVVAATAGATILFLIAQTSVGEPLAARAGPFLAKLRTGFQENALSYLLFLRLVPAFPFWLVNLAPALLGVPLRTYVVATFVGIIPGTFAFASVGTGLDSIIEAQQRARQACLEAAPANSEGCGFSLDPSSLLTPELIFAFVALGVVALIPVLVKKFRNRTRPRSTG